MATQEEAAEQLCLPWLGRPVKVISGAFRGYRGQVDMVTVVTVIGDYEPRLEVLLTREPYRVWFLLSQLELDEEAKRDSEQTA